MRLSWPVEIAGTGVSMPDRIVTNEDFVRRLDTTNEWIVQRTGIQQRRLAEPHESTLRFATAASRAALTDAGVTAEQVDLIICATITPEHPLPSTSCELQAVLGCRWVPAFDLVAACSGFVYGLLTAAQYICCGMAETALVVGADTMSRMTDMEDRATAILFGDGAAAAVVRRARRPECGILAARMGADGARGELIWVPAGEGAGVASNGERTTALHAHEGTRSLQVCGHPDAGLDRRDPA
jgi:3-oxoacyl-[acyl-carrier-protein] synthase-3